MIKDNSIIDNGKLRIKCNIPILSLLHFEFEVEPNNHAYAKLKIILEDKEDTESILKHIHGETIDVVSTLPDGSEEFPPLFSGSILTCEIHYEGGYREADILMVSGSYSLDTKKKYRSFQDISMSYKELIDHLLRNKEKSSFLYTAEQCTLDKPVIQYEESDFTFLKRMASHLHTSIYPDTTTSSPRILFGLPKGEDRGECHASNYCLGMEGKIRSYEIVSTQVYEIGDSILFHGDKYKVCKKKGALTEGILTFTYVIALKQWVRQERKWNPLLIGASLSGTVTDTRQEEIKLHLDIDVGRDKEKAYFFPWRPETGNLMYCMPEIGTKVYLHIGSREEGDAYAISCIRQNGTYCPETQDTKKRYLSNDYGKNLKLHPEQLEFQTRDKAGRNARFRLHDVNGIFFQSGQAITIKAEQQVQFMGRKVSVTTPKEMTVFKKDLISPTVMNLCNTIDILGKQGKITSQGGRAIPQKITSRTEQKCGIEDISEQVLSTIPQEVDEKGLGKVLSGSFVNTIYSRK